MELQDAINWLQEAGKGNLTITTTPNGAVMLSYLPDRFQNRVMVVGTDLLNAIEQGIELAV